MWEHVSEQKEGKESKRKKDLSSFYNQLPHQYFDSDCLWFQLRATLSKLLMSFNWLVIPTFLPHPTPINISVEGIHPFLACLNQVFLLTPACPTPVTARVISHISLYMIYVYDIYITVSHLSAVLGAFHHLIPPGLSCEATSQSRDGT